MRSFESKIVTLFILFILGVQLAGFIFLQDALESKVRFAIETELANGEQIIQQLLNHQTTELTDAVARLVNDHEFANTVITNYQVDHKKLESVLSSYAGQLNASIAWITGKDGRIQVASSHQLSAHLKEVSTHMILHAGLQDYVSTITVNNHIPLKLDAA
jgi:glutaminase